MVHFSLLKWFSLLSSRIASVACPVILQRIFLNKHVKISISTNGLLRRGVNKVVAEIILRTVLHNRT